MAKNTIYLDHASTTPVRKEVYRAVLPHLYHTYGNPGSMHHVGRNAQETLDTARNTIANVLDVSANEILFTGSGTEANNCALYGVAHAYKERGMHLLISTIEHASVLSMATRLEREGFEVEYIPVDAYGRISVEYVLSRIRTDTILISVMYANNEIGTIEPIEMLGKRVRTHFSAHSRPLIHTDACQATGQLAITPQRLNVDLMTLNSSKIYGPKGVGLLYVQKDVSLAPLILGGGQELQRRAGTENVPSIVGFAKALTLAEEERPVFEKKAKVLRDTCIAKIMETIPQATLNGDPVERLPNNIHFSFPYIEGESLTLMLDTYGICVSTGSACGSHDLTPSHVLRAIGQTNEHIHGSIRITLGHTTTEEDLQYMVDMLQKSVRQLELLSPLPLITL